jgi:hypothetical protein
MENKLDLITGSEQIYSALEESEDCQTIIAIACPDLGPGVFMTFVKEIIVEGGEKIAVVNSYDITGYFLEKNRIPVRNITSVIPFKGVFVNPFLKQLHQGSRTEAAEKKQDIDYIF